MAKGISRSAPVGKSKLFKTGRVPQTQPMGSGGNTTQDKIGKTGVTKGGSSRPAQNFDHLPSGNSMPNAGMKRGNTSGAPKAKGTKMQTWDHLPDRPE